MSMSRQIIASCACFICVSFSMSCATGEVSNLSWPAWYYWIMASFWAIQALLFSLPIIARIFRAVTE